MKLLVPFSQVLRILQDSDLLVFAIGYVSGYAVEAGQPALFIAEAADDRLQPAGGAVPVVEFQRQGRFSFGISPLFFKNFFSGQRFHGDPEGWRRQLFLDDLTEAFLRGETEDGFDGRSDIDGLQIHIHHPQDVVHVFSEKSVLIFAFSELLLRLLDGGDIAQTDQMTGQISLLIEEGSAERVKNSAVLVDLDVGVRCGMNQPDQRRVIDKRPVSEPTRAVR